MRTMPATVVSDPDFDTSTVRTPSQLIVPADTRSPFLLALGMGSPVSAASSTEDVPFTMTPSTGILSPGKIKILSVGLIASTDIIFESGDFEEEDDSETSNRQVEGTKFIKSLISLEAFNFARSSTARPRRTNANNMTGSSKNVGHISFGTNAATEDIPKEAIAPMLTKEFMFGPPLLNALKPSVKISRPGPTIAKSDNATCVCVLHKNPREWIFK
mmetsp:Transcript_3655/g.12272  ORF Transcript_3655/g.12272 Transcript_3655/m.12272 type:complete len:216 (+) Transcript_3655:2492-3139(+)